MVAKSVAKFEKDFRSGVDGYRLKEEEEEEDCRGAHD